jgi:hypothetical protein
MGYLREGVGDTRRIPLRFAKRPRTESKAYRARDGNAPFRDEVRSAPGSSRMPYERVRVEDRWPPARCLIFVSAEYPFGARPEEWRRGYAFTGAIALDRLIAGVVELPTKMASQRAPERLGTIARIRK